MQILAINQNSNNSMNLGKTSPLFKSTYPVYYWVKDGSNKYSPAVTLDLWKKLQRQLVQVLNNTKKSKEVIPGSRKKIQEYIASNDNDYKIEKVYDAKSHSIKEKPSPVRSFYNSQSGKKQEKFKPLGFLITGEEDVTAFENDLCKQIGKTKHYSKEIIGSTNTAETQLVINNYFSRGAYRTENKSNVFYSNDVPEGSASLHAKYIIIRTKTGSIKDIVLEDVKFLPNEGERNPFNKLANK